MIIKFNNGNAVVLCSKCRTILRYKTIDDTKDSPPAYCKEC